MLILFFLFPRVQGPLWGLPQDAYRGVTGLSDSMSPGAISRLSQSDAIAFRVKFSETPPPKPQLRTGAGPGGILELRGRTARVMAPYARNSSSKPAVSPTTTRSRWSRITTIGCSALELAAKIPPNASVSADHVLFARTPVRTRIRYDMRSYTNFARAARTVRTTSGRDCSCLRDSIRARVGWRRNGRRTARTARRSRRRLSTISAGRNSSTR